MDYINYNEFIENIRLSISILLDPKYQVNIKRKLGNNGIKIDTLCISLKDELFDHETNMQRYFNTYLFGTNIKSIIDKIYLSIKYFYDDSFRKNIKNYNQIKKTIMYKIINAEKNQELIKNIPNSSFLDFSIVYYLHFSTYHSSAENNKIEDYDMLIENKHMEIWNTTKEKLHEVAMKNMCNELSVRFTSMNQFIKEFNPDIIEDTDSSTYILSNYLNYYGAGSVIYNNALKDFSESIHSDLIILPSSVHEVIIIPDYNVNYNSLLEIVKDMNKNALLTEEFLSENIYKYRRETQEFSIIFKK